MVFEPISAVLRHLQTAQNRMEMMTTRTSRTPMMMVGNNNYKYRGTSSSSCASSNGSISSFAPVPVSSRNRLTTVKSSLVEEFEICGQESSEQLQPRNDEPNIYNFPSSISAEYRPLSPSLRISVAALSLLSALKINLTVATSAAKRSLNPEHPLWTWTAKRIMKVIAMAFCTFLFSTTMVQEAFYSPDRIDTQTLLKNKWLPSPLSRFSTVMTSIPIELRSGPVPAELDIQPIGVHFLEYRSKSRAQTLDPSTYKFDAIHFSHGFGASSLSWLPALPKLVDRLGARVGIAHDAPGFGFTDRPEASGRENGLVPFSAAGSASIGNALLLNTLEKNRFEDSNESKSVALFGHSMGCATTLRMALTLPKDVRKTIVLVAPALVGDDPSKLTMSSVDEVPKIDEDLVEKTKTNVAGIIDTQLSKIRAKIGILIALLRRVIIDPFIIFILKRVVGRVNFWSSGLRLVWGNPDILSESDVLRFQWPAIGLGWESGLLAFTRSRIASICSYSGGELKLLQDVLKQRNTSVIIVHGERDRIVPLSMTRKIVNLDVFKDKDVTFISMPGQGHDPFEEGCEEFVGIVESELCKSR